MTREETINKAKELGLSGEVVSISTIKANPKNPRVIKDERFEKLKASIHDFPKMMALRPMVVDEDNIVLGGNMRLRALEALGYRFVPTEWVKDANTLTAKEKERFIIEDNVPFGEWDWDELANEWDEQELGEWGLEVWKDVEDLQPSDDIDEYQRKKKEFEDKMAAGALDEDDPEYQEFLEKFQQKKTTDDCYTPEPVYEVVANWVANEYHVDKANFVRPFHPNGDYQKEQYKPTDIVVDNPPFSILAEILRFYMERGIRFFLFAPSLTLFSSPSGKCTALPLAVQVVYDNGANVNTSFLTNLEDPSIRFRSVPSLYKAVKEANDIVLKGTRKQLPKYSYDHHIVTSTFVGQLSRLGIEFSVPVAESQPIAQLDCQKESGKTIFGGGYIVSERVFAEREKAEREKAEREKAEREKAEREKAEREKAERWELSQREREIVRSLSVRVNE